jgi:hypothetical protein
VLFQPHPLDGIQAEALRSLTVGGEFGGYCEVFPRVGEEVGHVIKSEIGCYH